MQAERVATWHVPDPDCVGKAIINNGSTQPIYDVAVEFYNGDYKWRAVVGLRLALPGVTELPWPSELKELEGIKEGDFPDEIQPHRWLVAIRFRDVHGAIWHRNVHGVLWNIATSGVAMGERRDPEAGSPAVVVHAT